MREAELAHKLFELKAKKKELNEKLSDLNKEIFATESDLLRKMQDADLYDLGTENGRVYRQQKTVPKVVNWDQFYDYIYREQAGHMLERRPSVTACREMFDEGISIPGVDPHTFEQVSTRSKS